MSEKKSVELVKPGNTRHNELLEYEREQRSWSREYVADRIGAPETKMVYRWEREGVLPNHYYRQALSALFEKSQRELGLVKKDEIPFWNVPFRRNLFFTGRENILTQLHTILEKEKTAALSQAHAISGLGGIGKTQAAIEYAYQYGHEYQSVLWARADSREVLISDLAEIAVLLRLAESDAKDQKRAIEAMRRWLGALTRWLLILDNVEDLRIIGDFIPLQGQGHTLLTTRIQFTGTIAQGIDLDVMGSEEGTLFLLRRAKLIQQDISLASTADYANAKDLSQLMGGLPLALDQAGAYIEEMGCSVGEYLEIYQSEGIALLKERGMFANGHPEAVVSTLLLSFEKVQQANPLAAKLLLFLAFLHPDAIPEEIITRGVSELGPAFQSVANNKFKLNTLIRELRKFSLIRRNPVDKVLTIHRLVQAVLKSTLNVEATLQWAERTVRAVSRVFPEVQVATWPQCERCLSHAQVCADLVAKYQFEFPEAARLLNLTGRYLYERGRFAEADPLLHQALEIREKVLGSEHLDTATSLNDLALLYHAQGKYEQAEPLYLHALQVRKLLLGLEHPETATVLYNLAVLFHAQGKYKQAESFYQQALQIREEILGPEHSDTASNLNDLAVLYADQGNYLQAVALGERVLAIKEQILEPDHPDIAISLSNLAGFYHAQGKYEQAEPLYKRAYLIFEKVLGALHTYTASSLDNLAGLYEDQGKYKQAEALSRNALAIKEKVLGLEHPEVIQSLITLASLYQAQEKYGQAEPLYQRALRICEKQLGAEHAYTAGSLTYLAILYTEQGKYELAEPLSIRALMIKEKVLGPEHASTATSLDNLAAIRYGQGKYEQAELLCLRALSIREQVLEPQHLHIAASLLTLANIYIDESNYRDAEPLLQRALAIREQALGAEHPEVAKALESYTGLLTRLERGGEAAELKARIRAIHTKQSRELSTFSTGVEESTNAQTYGANPLKDFLAACCELHPDAFSSASDLWAAYQHWVQESGERFPIRTQNAFGRYLKLIKCTPYRTNKNRMWRGITLRNRYDEIVTHSDTK